MEIKLFVVIVTYNRIDKLKKALNSYQAQICQPTKIIVVNNRSTDGTSEFLEGWESSDNTQTSRQVLSMDKNLGGAGGFRTGIQEAINQGADWIWIADDDAYPEPDALQKIVECIDANKFKDAACICGTVYNIDHIDIDHRRITEKGVVWKPKRLSIADYEKEYIYIDETSYVGSCYNVNKLKTAGLPNDQLFIYFDDTEHSHRVAEQGKIVLVPSIKIIHDTNSYSMPEPDVISTWREFYLLRNHVYTLKKYHSRTYLFYILYKLCKMCKDYTIHKNKEMWNMYMTALKDGMNECLGVHEIYKPGFEIKEQTNVLCKQ